MHIPTTSLRKNNIDNETLENQAWQQRGTVLRSSKPVVVGGHVFIDSNKAQVGSASFSQDQMNNKSCF
jgi:hypothetical protein